MSNLIKMPKAIAAAIKETMGKVKMLGKDEDNKFASYKYASIDQFLESLRPKLAETGLSVVSDETSAEHFTMKENKKDGSSVDSTFVHYAYDFYLAHEDSGETYGPLRRSVDLRFVGPQTSGQAQSYCEKMFLRALLKVATGDKDADEQEQGEFTGKKSKKITTIEKTGNPAVDKVFKDSMGHIEATVDEESCLQVSRYQYKLLKESGATVEMLEMLTDAKDNKLAYLRNKNDGL